MVEVDGDSHFIKEEMERDLVRTEYMSTLGIRTIRFRNNEVMQDIESVLDRIRQACITTPAPLLE